MAMCIKTLSIRPYNSRASLKNPRDVITGNHTASGSSSPSIIVICVIVRHRFAANAEREMTHMTIMTMFSRTSGTANDRPV
jgi:hypothetical protein